MDDEDVVFELICEECGTEYTISSIGEYQEEFEEPPSYCPFCGSEIDISMLDDEEDDEYDELDYDEEL